MNAEHEAVMIVTRYNTSTLPQSITAGYLNVPVEPFVLNPLRCFKCQKYGHGQNACRGKLTCARCGQFDHDSKRSQQDLLCINCKGDHFTYSRECPRWKVEKRVQQVKVKKRLTFADARKLVEILQPATAAKSYAAAVKVSSRSISVNTDLTWPYNEVTFKKLSHREKTVKQAAKAVPQQNEATQKKKNVSTVSASTSMTQVSLDSQNPLGKPSAGVPVPSLAGKDTKKQTKDCRSG
ncbi:uncharacterized protein LOC121383611 [Gigantopelta aegis]|uniref:uncharacterized protein LOC121383611 n=1 Tax=Gigantopelta aegis TaxID=1735272 RepID=UPI001B887D80|nr:uncharacterized protein LOC121383611 [Gigantopelta aegis]